MEAAREILEKVGLVGGRGEDRSGDDASPVSSRELGEDGEMQSGKERRPLKKWLGIW